MPNTGFRMSNIRVLVSVVYHSGCGHTDEQAEAVAVGASSLANANSLLISVDDIERHWHALETSDAIIFGCPTCMGSASAPFKQFMDQSSDRAFVEGKWRNKVAAGFTNGAARAGDKLNTLVQLAIFAAQQGMHWVSLGLPIGADAYMDYEVMPGDQGCFLGVADHTGIVAAHAVRSSSLPTSRYLGRRVAEVALQLAIARDVSAKQ